MLCFSLYIQHVLFLRFAAVQSLTTSNPLVKPANSPTSLWCACCICTGAFWQPPSSRSHSSRFLRHVGAHFWSRGSRDSFKTRKKRKTSLRSFFLFLHHLFSAETKKKDWWDGCPALRGAPGASAVCAWKCVSLADTHAHTDMTVINLRLC